MMEKILSCGSRNKFLFIKFAFIVCVGTLLDANKGRSWKWISNKSKFLEWNLSWLQANCLFKGFYFDYLIFVRKLLKLVFKQWRQAGRTAAKAIQKDVSSVVGSFVHHKNFCLPHSLRNISFQEFLHEMKSKEMVK